MVRSQFGADLFGIGYGMAEAKGGQSKTHRLRKHQWELGQCAWELAFIISQKTIKSPGILGRDWETFDSLKSSTVGIFALQKLIIAVKQGFPPEQVVNHLPAHH